MRIVHLSRAQCSQLFHLLSEDLLSRANTEDNGGIPVFDTETATIHFVDTSVRSVRFGSTEVWEADQEDLEIAVDAGLLSLPKEDQWRFDRALVPRFVEVPTFPQALINQTLNQEGRPKGLEKRIVLEELKNEETKHVTIDWLVKVGDERGIRYQFQIADVALGELELRLEED